MRKILLSIAVIALVGGAAAGMTGAFFSDTETSTGNTFTAGAIDLQIDNHAWYNGLECAQVGEDEWEWVGDETGDSYMDSLIGETCTSSWTLSDLDGKVFFDFGDLKPGDWEEDTISLHVNNNDAWVCANLEITSDDDMSSTEPELTYGDSEDTESIWDGELGEELSFIFWADDGDNVLEDHESVVLSGSPSDLPQGEGGQTFAIADSNGSIYGEGPLVGDEEYYIGKAFCFGDLYINEVDGFDGEVPIWNDPADYPGFDCSGVLTSNVSQTDEVTANMTFTAIQSRNNSNYVCGDEITPDQED